jgi:succinylglutamic semialdehyde dehydrogenase
MMREREIISFNPYDESVVGSVQAALETDVRVAFEVAVDAQKAWAANGFEKRCQVLRSYAALLKEQAEDLADLITREAGKPLWESRTEVQAMINKVEISIDAHQARCGEFAKGIGVTRFHPLGVVGVLGPFNFPGHLPNGHIVPALLAGNAVLFKPSELTPLVGQFIVARLHQSGVPESILQILHGGAEIGRAIVALEGLRGLFFTGSSKAGLSIHKELAGRPQTLLALEMGGNNPLVVDHVEDPEAASRLVCQSAFITAGQRCTCARRVLVPSSEWGDAFLERLKADVGMIEVGNPSGGQQPYIGTVISQEAAEKVLQFEAGLIERGAHPILQMKRVGDRKAQLKPGLIDVTGTALTDEECFGPLLQVQRYTSLGHAYELCNQTAYGLAAGLLSDSAEVYAEFQQAVMAGIINWNSPLTGASSASPFGGVGLSGNYRPSAYFAADYCSYPVASIENTELPAQEALPGFPLTGESS